MGFHSPSKNCMTIGFSASNPLASTAYRFIKTNLPLTVAPLYAYFIPSRNSVVTGLHFSSICDNNASVLATNIYLRNVSTSTNYDCGLLNCTDFDAAIGGGRKGYYLMNDDLSIPLTKDNLYQFMYTTPAWVTAPTNWTAQGILKYV